MRRLLDFKYCAAVFERTFRFEADGKNFVHRMAYMSSESQLLHLLWFYAH